MIEIPGRYSHLLVSRLTSEIGMTPVVQLMVVKVVE